MNKLCSDDEYYYRIIALTHFMVFFKGCPMESSVTLIQPPQGKVPMVKC